VSAIDPMSPADSDQRSQGASRIREHRTWLEDMAEAFLVRHHGSGLDPATYSGALKLPFTQPDPLAAGDMFLDHINKLIYNVRAGGGVQLTGDLERNTVSTFQQASAPVGWTRDTSFTAKTGLRYRASASLSSGGTYDPTATLGHPGDFLTAQWSGPVQVIKHPVDAHLALKWIDVIMASRQ